MLPMKNRAILKRIVILLLIAYLVCAGRRLFDFFAEELFLEYWIITSVMLVIYCFIITYIYTHYFIKDYILAERRVQRRMVWRFGLRIIGAILLFHTYGVRFFYRLREESLWSGVFIWGGLPMLALALVGYSYFLLRFSHKSILYSLVVSRFSGVIHFLLNFNAEVPTAVSFKEEVKLFEQELERAVLHNGQKQLALSVLCIQYGNVPYCYSVGKRREHIWTTSSHLASLGVSDWFVQIRNGFYVNLWYFLLPTKGNVLVPCNADVEMEMQHIAQQLGISVGDLLRVSVNLKKQVLSRMSNITTFSTNWEGQYIDLKGK